MPQNRISQPLVHTFSTIFGLVGKVYIKAPKISPQNRKRQQKSINVVFVTNSPQLPDFCQEKAKERLAN